MCGRDVRGVMEIELRIGKTECDGARQSEAINRMLEIATEYGLDRTIEVAAKTEGERSRQSTEVLRRVERTELAAETVEHELV